MLATSAAFSAKAATWPTAQASGDGRRRPLVTLLEEYKKRVWRYWRSNCGQWQTHLATRTKHYQPRTAKNVS